MSYKKLTEINHKVIEISHKEVTNKVTHMSHRKRSHRNKSKT